jgi:hypothetical protein
MSVRVRPISANLTHDTELIDRMVPPLPIQDPYCKIYFGGQQFRTQVCEFGGKTPQWSDTFILNPCGDSTLRVEVWDHDSVNDDLVGAGTFNIQGVFGNPNMGSRNGTSPFMQNMSIFSIRDDQPAGCCSASTSRT